MSQLLSVVAASALLLAGCSSSGDDAPVTNTAGVTSQPTSPAATQPEVSATDEPTESVVTAPVGPGTGTPGTEEGSGTRTPASTVDTPTGDDPADDPSAAPVVSGLAEGFLSEVTLQLDPDQAACIARGYVRVVGVDAFADADPSDAKQLMKALNAIAGDATYTDGLVDTFAGCGAAIKGAASTAISESTEELTEEKQVELVKCVAAQLDDNQAAEILRGKLGPEGNTEATAAGQTLAQLGTGCGFTMRVYP
ncbi:hypothetical protein D1871_19770 [Nakamurella silvestris]|nr:hypothetical protein D1871_19770 [Nakamurella silvestris]